MYKLFPHFSVDTKDDSLTILHEVENLPLFRPVFILKTEKGPVGVPTYTKDKTTFDAIFGEETLNKNNKKYFCRDSVFLSYIFPYSGAFIIRLDDDGMSKASSVIELAINTTNSTYTYSTRAIDYDNDESIESIANQAIAAVPVNTVDNVNSPEAVDSTLSISLDNGVHSAGSVTAGVPYAHTVNDVVVGYQIQLFVSVPGSGSKTFGSTKIGVIGNIEDLINVKVSFIATDLTGNGDGASDLSGWANQSIWRNAVAWGDVSNDQYISEAFDYSNFHVEDDNVYVNFNELVANCDGIIVELVMAGSEEPVVDSITAGTTGYVYNVTSETYTIPIAAFESKYVGEYGNNYSFNLRPNTDRTDYDEMKRLNAFVYGLNFGVYKNNNSTPTPYPTRFSSSSFDILFDSNILDPSINNDLGYDSVIPRYFGTDYPEPITGKVYEANVAKVYDILKPVVYSVAQDSGATYHEAANYIYDVLSNNPAEIDILRLTTLPENSSTFATDFGSSTITTSGLVDVATISGLTYEDNTETDGGLTKNGYIRLTGGSNGALDNAYNGIEVDGSPDSPDGTINNSKTIESKIADVWGNGYMGEMLDSPRYPFNMMVDSGHTAPVKNEMISFMAFRNDIKSVLSTWDGQVSNPDEASSVTAGNSYITNIRMIKDSEIYNTGANRGIVFGQVGYVDRDVYDGLIPLTLWYCVKLAQMHNSDYIKENPEGESAQLDTFTSVTWAPYKDTSKRSLWGANVNYCQYFNMTQLHFPSLKSVYAYESSLFTNDAFVNKVIYIKQLLPAIWAKYSGSTEPNEIVYGKALNDINDKLKHMLNGTAQFNARFYQTAKEKESGFEHHLDVELLDSMGQRIWHIDIIANRLD